jgi:hypothetical protein
MQLARLFINTDEYVRSMTGRPVALLLDRLHILPTCYAATIICLAAIRIARTSPDFNHLKGKYMIVNLSKKMASMAVAGVLAVTLSACGGGGGGTSNTTTGATLVTSSFPVQQALAYAFTHGLQSQLTITGTASNAGTVYPVTGTLTYTLGAAVNATFNGATALQSTETINGTISINSMSQPLSISSPLYMNSQYAPIGSNVPGSYCVASGTTGYPATATSGQTGEIASFNCYSDSTKVTLVSTQKITFVTTAGNDSNSLNFQMLSNVYDTANKLQSSATTTYAISTAGIPTLSRVQLSGTASGVTINIDAK